MSLLCDDLLQIFRDVPGVGLQISFQHQRWASAESTKICFSLLSTSSRLVLSCHGTDYDIELNTHEKKRIDEYVASCGAFAEEKRDFRILKDSSDLNFSKSVNDTLHLLKIYSAVSTNKNVKPSYKITIPKIDSDEKERRSMAKYYDGIYDTIFYCLTLDYRINIA